MGFLSRVVEGLRGAGTPAPPTVQIVTSEAIDLPDIRNDDHDRFFSTLLGAGASRFNLRRAAEVSAAVAERNPMARRILRLDLDYTIGSQITASPKLPNDQDERQAEIDAELRRTVRRYKLSTQWWSKLFRRFLVEGEIAVKLIPATDPRYPRRPVIMSTTELDLVKNADTDDVVALLNQTITRGDRYRVLNTMSADDEGHEYKAEILYFRHDESGDRGVPELLPLLNRLTWENEIASLSVKRFKSLMRWFWHAVAEDASQEQIDALNDAQSIAPRTASVRWSNGKVRWEAVTPALQADDTQTFARNLRAGIAGGAGQPSHWHGDGGDVNLATAEAMDEPTFRHFERLQGEFFEIASTVLSLIADDLRQLGRVGEFDPDELSWDLALPVLGTEDLERSTRALAQGTAAAANMRAEGLITFEATKRIGRELISKSLDLELRDEDLPEQTEHDHGAPPVAEPDEVTEAILPRGSRIVVEFPRGSDAGPGFKGTARGTVVAVGPEVSDVMLGSEVHVGLYEFTAWPADRVAIVDSFDIVADEV
jgi:hypothetical protein